MYVSISRRSWRGIYIHNVPPTAIALITGQSGLDWCLSFRGYFVSRKRMPSPGAVARPRPKYLVNGSSCRQHSPRCCQVEGSQGSRPLRCSDIRYRVGSMYVRSPLLSSSLLNSLYLRHARIRILSCSHVFRRSSSSSPRGRSRQDNSLRRHRSHPRYRDRGYP